MLLPGSYVMKRVLLRDYVAYYLSPIFLQTSVIIFWEVWEGYMEIWAPKLLR